MKNTSTKKKTLVKAEIKENEILLMQISAEQHLRKTIEDSEKRYNTMLMQSPFAFAILKGKDMVVAMANDSIKQMWGKGSKVEGKPLIEILPEIKDQEFPVLLHKVYSTGIPYVTNESLARMERKGKMEDVYFNFSYQPFTENDGTISGIIIFAIEVTEQVLARKKIEESENRFRTMANSIPEVIWVADVQGQPEFFNKRWEEFSGVPFEVNTVAEVAAEFLHPDDAPAVLAAFSEAIKTGSLMEVEQRNRSASGEYRWFLNRAAPYRNLQTGEIEKWFGIGTDIDERKQAEEKIKESEHRFRNLVEKAMFPICIFTGEDLILEMVNEPLLNIWQVGNEAVGKPFLEILPEMKDQPILNWLLEVYNNGVTLNLQEIPIFFIRKNGEKETLYFNFAYEPYHESNGKTIGVIAMATNITDQIVARKIIEESDQKIRNLIAQAPVAMCLYKSPDFMVEIVNKKMLNIWNKKSDEIINKSIFITMPEVRAQGFEELLQKVFSTGESFSANEVPINLMRNGNNEKMYINILYEAFTESNGIISGVLEVAHDVTEQVLNRKKIEESEARYKSLIAAAPIGIGVFIGRDLVLQSANQQLINIMGKGSGIEGKKLTDLMPELIEQRQPYLKILDDVFTTGELYQSLSDPVSILRNGELHNEFYDINCVPLFDAEGKVYGIMNIATDVTLQTQFNKKIKASEEKFRFLVSQAPAAICVLRGENYSIEVINERMLGMWDLSIEQVAYKPAFDVLSEFKKQGFKEILDHVYRTNKRFVAEELLINVIRNEKLENAFVKFVFEPLRDADGTISDVMVLAHEITEQVVTRKKIEESEKLLEQKVIERTQQLSEKNIELQKMNIELEAFTYISSHDLQEPLRKIQTFAGRIIAKEKEHLSESAKDYFNRMQDEAARMQTLIQDLLDFSRISTSERKFEKTHLNIILNQVKVEFKEALEEKNGNISIIEMCEANIIPFQFHQLFYNLINNALKFSKPNVPPYITVKSTIITGTSSPFYPKRACKISIADNGIGFDKQFSERIFGVFQKLHGKHEYAGTGIGLAIVKKIVENHNGIITAESELGNGATFIIYLPE